MVQLHDTQAMMMMTTDRTTSVTTLRAMIKLSTAWKTSYDELIFKNTYIHFGKN
jgi:hypothetical protein